MHEGSRRAILAAFLANLGIAIAKFVGFLITGRPACSPRPVHSLADTGNQVLLLLGGKRAAQGRRHDAPVRLRARALLLGVRRRPRAVLDGRPVRPLRGHREAAPPARGREPRRGHRHPRSFAIVLETLSLRTAYREATPPHRARRRGWWRWIRALEAARAARRAARGHRRRSIGLVFALTGVIAGPRHRRAALGRRRLDRHRRAADRHRHPPGDRDEGPADRRVGDPTRTSTAIVTTPRAARRRAAHHPPADRAPRPRRAARRRQARVRPVTVGRGARRGDRRAPSATLRAAVPTARIVFIEPDIYRATADVTAAVADVAPRPRSTPSRRSACSPWSPPCWRSPAARRSSSGPRCPARSSRSGG